MTTPVRPLARRSTALAITIVAVAGGVGLGGGVLAATVQGPASSAQRGTPAIYYADGVIHDGSSHVAFQPPPGRTVLAVVGTVAGWLVAERAGSGDGALELVQHDGSTKELANHGGLGYDVSPTGDAVAVADGASPVVRLVSPRSGAVLRQVTAPFTGLRGVRLGGDQIMADGYPRRGTPRIARTSAHADHWTTVRLALPGAQTLEDVSSDGRRVLVGYLHGKTPCTAVAVVTTPTAPVWATCDVQPAAHASFSPDGSRLVMLGNTNGSEPPLVILDSRTGQRDTSLPGSRWLSGVSWVSNDELMIAAATSSQFEAFTVRACSVTTGTCRYLPGATPSAPATSAAVGWRG